jgi:hypothetical protein
VVKRASTVFGKEMTMQKGGFCGALNISFPNKLIAYPRNCLPQPGDGLVELLLAGIPQGNGLPSRC